jgi:O-antigen/teichoic acid export membrane protein
MKGDTVVGYYSAALKYVDGLLIIPQYFTQAIFPLMSRYAATSRDSLMRAYVLSLRLLLIVALPIAAAMPFIAEGLIMVLGGGEYLPDSMIALQIIIWFLPFSFVNSVTQYVLIAVGQQRFLTKAFVIGVLFNTGANLIFIPQYGYRAAAVVTILSEVSLLIPFYLAVRRHVAVMPWVELLWRQVAAAAGMALVAWALFGQSEWVAAGAGLVVYAALLVLLGTFRDDDMQRVRRALPFGRRRQRAAVLEE